MNIKNLVIAALAIMLTLPATAQTRKGAVVKRQTTTTKRPIQQTTKPTLVDLGLPSGTKWADRNIGAISTTSTGSYFAYGETTTKQTYTKANYTFNADINNIAGTEYDAATKKYGKGWSIPTKEQWQELFDNCKQEFTLVNKLFVVKLTGANGKSINLPFPSNGISIKYGTAEQTKLICESLLSPFTNNETFNNMLRLAKYNGFTYRLSTVFYQVAEKQLAAQALGFITIDKNGKINEHGKIAQIVDNANPEAGIFVRPVYCNPNTNKAEDTGEDTIELPE